MIEEQHVTQYGSLLDPNASWYEQLVMHEYNEVYMYWSFLQTESNPRIKAIWELHLGMELEHLRLARELMLDQEGRDAADLLPAMLPELVTFEPNKEYVRTVLERTVEFTGIATDCVERSALSDDHRYFIYQDAVHGDSEVPSSLVVAHAAEKLGRDYRLQTEGEHPVPRLREDKGLPIEGTRSFESGTFRNSSRSTGRLPVRGNADVSMGSDAQH